MVMFEEHKMADGRKGRRAKWMPRRCERVVRKRGGTSMSNLYYSEAFVFLTRPTSICHHLPSAYLSSQHTDCSSPACGSLPSAWTLWRMYMHMREAFSAQAPRPDLTNPVEGGLECKPVWRRQLRGRISTAVAAYANRKQQTMSGSA